MMNFDDEIDKLESHFRNPDFQASLGTDQLRELETTFVAMTRDLYQLRKLEKSGAENSEEVSALRESVEKQIKQCREMAGLE